MTRDDTSSSSRRVSGGRPEHQPRPARRRTPPTGSPGSTAPVPEPADVPPTVYLDATRATGDVRHAVAIHDPDWALHGGHGPRMSVCGLTGCGVFHREFKLGRRGNCRSCERAVRVAAQA